MFTRTDTAAQRWCGRSAVVTAAIALGVLGLQAPGQAYPSSDDIHVAKADGSASVPLVTGPGDDELPAWSPDGRLAFSSNRDGDYEIYVMNRDGSIVQLTDHPGIDTEPDWSGDGTRLAFSSDRTGNFDIHVMNADGSGVAALTRDPFHDTHPAFAPDGSRIAFTGYRKGVFNIFAVSADGTKEVQLTKDGSANDHAAWSRDGKRIAFTSGGGVMVMNADGSSVKGLTNGAQPDWAPDGSRIVYSRSPNGWDDDVYVIGVDGPSEAAPLGDQTGHASWPAWSPDGTLIAYNYHPQ